MPYCTRSGGWIGTQSIPVNSCEQCAAGWDCVDGSGNLIGRAAQGVAAEGDINDLGPPDGSVAKGADGVFRGMGPGGGAAAPRLSNAADPTPRRSPSRTGGGGWGGDGGQAASGVGGGSTGAMSMMDPNTWFGFNSGGPGSPGPGIQAGPGQVSTSYQSRYGTLGDVWNPNRGGGQFVAGAQSGFGNAANFNPSVPGMPRTAYDRYNALATDPSQTTGSPVYHALKKQVMDGLQRRLAASRMSKSGNALLATADAGNQVFSQANNMLLGAAAPAAQQEYGNWQALAQNNAQQQGLTLEAALGAAGGQNQAYQTLLNERQGDLAAAQGTTINNPWGFMR